jgi:hypothetical protein
MNRKAITGMSAILAPLGFVAGWFILIQRAEQEPDFGWFLSHLLLLSGVILFVPAITGLGYLLKNHAKNAVNIGIGLGFLGAFAHVGQYAIDFAVGQLSSNASEMSSLFKRISSAPIIALPFYLVGPIAFYSGLLILILLLQKFRLISWWVGALAVVGIIAVVSGSIIGIAGITMLGFVGIWAGFAAIGWKILTESESLKLKSA